MILDYLEIRDILRVYQADSAMRNAIEGSTMLQTKLGLRAAPPETYPQTAFSSFGYFHRPCVPFGTASCGYNFSPFTCDIEPPLRRQHRDSHETLTATIRARFSVLPQQRLPNIGSRYRNMFICQPPVQQMQPTMCCCQRISGALDPVTSEHGLTIGDLYDYAKALLDKHRYVY